MCDLYANDSWYLPKSLLTWYLRSPNKGLAPNFKMKILPKAGLRAERRSCTVGNKIRLQKLSQFITFWSTK